MGIRLESIWFYLDLFDIIKLFYYDPLRYFYRVQLYGGLFVVGLS